MRPCDNVAMLIGAHVSTRGGIPNAVDNAVAIGAEVLQTHPTSAQQWRPLRLEHAVRQAYLHRYAASGLRAHYLHAVYLINLATPKEQLLRQSIGSLVHYMQLAEQLDADGVVFHPGSHLGAGFDGVLDQLAGAMREVLDTVPNSPATLLVENSAGSGGCVGCTFPELGRIVAAVGSDRVGVCLDTQHMFASGYDVRTPDQVRSTLDRFGKDVGFDRLGLIHANDSRKPLGSSVDRHANIGDGEMGVDAFRLLLADGRLNDVPWIIEVPGEEHCGPDLANINRLRDCAGLPARVLAEPVASR
jgi:deoxyribonuclease-4